MAREWGLSFRTFGYLVLVAFIMVFTFGLLWHNSHRFQWVSSVNILCSNLQLFDEDPSSEVNVKFPRMVYPKPLAVGPPSRTDVIVMTPWFAPIIWESTFSINILNEYFKERNIIIGLTAFAIKKYVVFTEKFLKTAEEYFMVGHKVNYYIFTDRPKDVPNLPLKEGRKLHIIEVRNYAQWQEVSMRRMEMINNYTKTKFIKEADYLVCVDIDMQFSDHVGVEILSDVFGTLHPAFFGASRDSFTYERRSESLAYIPPDEGDFYYAGGFFGGTPQEVYRLTKACHEAMMEDKKKGIEAVWHDESYLNKYFVYHKPTKILSPEYLWDNGMGSLPILKKKRFLAVPKNHAAIRSNDRK
ncbi:histo-blood group ABO system transferase-like isoform X2 [Protopterus annectens]|uniref:histo-blood group ABO system transferase-like isoform X2 n=1 Tax=Protopterus annectens TaxID=7888 RepID=UPI001CFBDF15|nr:histo-blood group ABO system transferase-like isoform X2 [Protopterus annectens]